MYYEYSQKNLNVTIFLRQNILNIFSKTKQNTSNCREEGTGEEILQLPDHIKI
jgi:hypothetical protein